MSHLMIVGRAMTAPDLAEEHVGAVLELMHDARGALTRSDVTAMIHDLRRAIGVLGDVRDALPVE